MKDYLSEIIEKFPIRRTTEQKHAFYDYVKANVDNYEVNVEKLENKHENIVIGNPETAKVIFTAHYDTPKASLIPNLILPKNKLLGYLYHLGYPIILALLSLGVAYLVQDVFKLDELVFISLYLVLYLGMFYLLTRAFINKNNSNDNTSGVSVILSLIEENPDKDIAFILFDNEEKGSLGSKAYKKAHPEISREKLFINLDCVGNGQHFIFINKKNATKLLEYQKLMISANGNSNYSIEFLPIEKSMSNSDHRNFECSVGIVACSKTKRGLYYTSRIHTKRDTLVNVDNIKFITTTLTNFINKI